MTRSVRTAAVGALVCLATPFAAMARPTGITGVSGQQSQTCTACHGTGAAVPTVTVEGPTTVQPGQSQQYTLVIQGGPAKVGGMNLSVDDPSATLLAGAGSRISAGQLTHSAPLAFSSGAARFPFTVVAPSSPGVMTLYAAGLSANGNGSTSGDGVGTAQLQVRVASTSSAGTPVPTPTPTTGTPAPTPTPTPGTTAPAPTPAPTPSPSDPTQATPVDDSLIYATPQTGCTAAAGAPALVAAMGALVSLARTRRRRRQG